MYGHGLVAIRSADGLFSLLYEPIDRVEVLSLGFHEVGRNPSDACSVNSTYFYRRAKIVN